MPHPFGDPDWAATWWTHFGTGLRLQILRLRRRSRDVAIIPLCATGRAGATLELLGGVDLTDYLGPVCERALEAESANTVARWLLSGDAGCDTLDLRFLSSGSKFAPVLAETLRAAGATVAVEDDGIVATLALARSWSQQLGLLTAKQRHEIRRKQRRFEELTGGKPAVRRSDARSIDADLETFISLHRRSRGPKGRFIVPAVASFFRDVAMRYLARDELALEFLEVDSCPLAATFGFVRDGQRFLYNMAYDPEHARLSPGIILLCELMRRATDSGARTFDLLRGDEEYKRRLGAHMEPLLRLRAVLPDPQSRIRRNVSPRA
jgi:CelD/BcsL family acetyltransferase involved in cellulose biosynthesis